MLISLRPKRRDKTDRWFAVTRCWSGGDSNWRSRLQKTRTGPAVRSDSLLELRGFEPPVSSDQKFSLLSRYEVCLPAKLRNELRAFGLAIPAHEPQHYRYSAIASLSLPPSLRCSLQKSPRLTYCVICPSEAQAPSSSQTNGALSPSVHSPRGQNGFHAGLRYRVIILGRQGATEVANAEPEFRFCPP